MPTKSLSREGLFVFCIAMFVILKVYRSTEEKRNGEICSFRFLGSVALCPK